MSKIVRVTLCLIMLLIPEFHISAQTTPSTVIYVKSNGNDNNNGTSTTTPVKTLGKAYTLLPATGSWDDNYIVLMDMIDIDNGSGVYSQNWCTNSTPPTYAKNVTITGSYGGTTYTTAGLAPKSATSSETITHLWGNTKMNHLKLQNAGNNNNAWRLYMQGHDLTIGEGVTVTNCRELPRNDAKVGAYTFSTGTGHDTVFQDITILGGWLDYNYTYTDATKLPYTFGQTGHITLLSGNYGRVIGGGRNSKINNTSGDVLGHKDRPWNVVITIGGTAQVNLLAGGQCDGTVFCNTTVNVQDNAFVARVVGGTLAYARRIPVPTTNSRHYVSANTFYGTSTINVTGGTIYQLYGGCLGRTTSNEKDSTFYYGRVNINISGGTIKQDVYAAGAGGIMGYHIQNGDPYNDDVDNNAVDGFDGVFSRTCNESYTTSTKVQISGNAVLEKNLYGGGYGFSDYLNATTSMALAGAFFGCDTIIISGGTISGNVFGGGKGYPYYPLKLSVAQTEGRTYVLQTAGTVNGGIYGAGDGITDHNIIYPTIAQHTGFTEVILQGGTTGNDIYGGGKLAQVLCDNVAIRHRDASNTIVTDTYNNATTSAMVDGSTFAHSVYGGGSVSEVKVTDATNNNANTYAYMTSGSVTGDLFGGGNQGVVTGNSHIIMTGGQLHGNIYGGGNNAAVSKNTEVRISGATTVIEGYVFGGGDEGAVNGGTVINMAGGHLLKSMFGGGNKATVAKDTDVAISGDSTVDVNVYGGGNEGEVTGNTHIKIGADN